MKPLTLTNLQADGACADGLAWIAPLLEAGGPSEADWGRRPFYWDWALYRGYDVPVTAVRQARHEPPPTWLLVLAVLLGILMCRGLSLWREAEHAASERHQEAVAIAIAEVALAKARGKEKE